MDIENDLVVQFCNIGNNHRLCNGDKDIHCHQDCGPGFEKATRVKTGVHMRALALNEAGSQDRYTYYNNVTLA